MASGAAVPAEPDDLGIDTPNPASLRRIRRTCQNCPEEGDTMVAGVEALQIYLKAVK
jgi:hypothetical protein